MTLREILQSKGSAVHTIAPSAILQDVVRKLVSHRCGSLVVCQDTEGDSRSRGAMIGIITERDILNAAAGHGAGFLRLRVADVMTTDIRVGSPNDSVEDTMGLMTELRIRHLPVVDGGKLLGLVSIGDVVKMQHDRLTMENHYLKNYLTDSGSYPAVV